MGLSRGVHRATISALLYCSFSERKVGHAWERLDGIWCSSLHGNNRRVIRLVACRFGRVTIHYNIRRLSMVDCTNDGWHSVHPHTFTQGGERRVRSKNE